MTEKQADMIIYRLNCLIALLTPAGMEIDLDQDTDTFYLKETRRAYPLKKRDEGY